MFHNRQLNSGMRRLASLLIGMILLSGLAGLPVSTTMAQNLQGIAAVVDDDIVTFRDVENRTRFLLLSSGTREPPRDLRGFHRQVLRVLVDERLQLAEAQRQGIRVSETELAAAKERIEARNNLPQGSFDRFLDRNNIDPETAETQLRATISWTKLISRRFATFASVSTDEIDDVLAGYERNVGKPRSRVAEIWLPFASIVEAREVGQLAQQIVDRVRAGGDFASLALEYSASPSARTGGRIGWIIPGQLAPEVESVIETLDPGQVSDPIQSSTGYRIMLVEDRETLMAVDPLLEKVRLHQVFLPLPSNPTSSDVNSVREQASDVASRAQRCEDMVALARSVDSPVEADIGTFELNQLSPSIRDGIDGLPVDTASKPVRLQAGFTVLMVCERTPPPSNLPTRTDIEMQLRNGKLEILAQRLLRDLRRSAFIETRL